MKNYSTYLKKYMEELDDVLNFKNYFFKFPLKDTKNYFFNIIFYRFLSEKMEDYFQSELKNHTLNFIELYNTDDSFKEELIKKSLDDLGYFIKPNYLFDNIVAEAKSKNNILKDFFEALNQIENFSTNQDSKNAFKNIFGDFCNDFSVLNFSPEEKNEILSNVVINVGSIDFSLDADEKNSYAHVFEGLIDYYSEHAGKASEDYFTPRKVSELLAKIVSLNKNQINSVYDPACGSALSLIDVANYADVSRFYGQEINKDTYNLARMNMIVHNIPFNKFDIKGGDSLESPQHTDMKFDAIVSNPPFSTYWSASKEFLEDARFNIVNKLPPKSKADYAFLEHMLYHLSDDGVIAAIVPHGVLFRGAAEGEIRRYLIEEMNCVDAVIGLPPNLFYGTSIATCILVLKKYRQEDDNVMFINASKEFTNLKKYNILSEENIDKIINAYANREEIDKYSHAAGLDEIKENGFSLNIPLYVNTFEEELIDLNEISRQSKEISAELEDIDKSIEKLEVELGINKKINI